MTQEGVRRQFKVAVKYLYERGPAGTATTVGPWVPQLKDLNVAKNTLIGKEVSGGTFEQLRYWTRRDATPLRQKPFAPPGGA